MPSLFDYFKQDVLSVIADYQQEKKGISYHRRKDIQDIQTILQLASLTPFSLNAETLPTEFDDVYESVKNKGFTKMV